MALPIGKQAVLQKTFTVFIPMWVLSNLHRIALWRDYILSLLVLRNKTKIPNGFISQISTLKQKKSGCFKQFVNTHEQQMILFFQNLYNHSFVSWEKIQKRFFFFCVILSVFVIYPHYICQQRIIKKDFWLVLTI